MSINSAVFLLFLAVSVTAYYLVPQKHRYLVLLAASVYFYLASSVKAAFYLLVTIGATYGASRWLEALHRLEKRKLSLDGVDRSAVKKQGKRSRRIVLSLSLGFNFLTLAVFKYLGSWLTGCSALLAFFGVDFQFRPLSLLLPLGISFYIFQTAGYLIDVYRGKTQPERNVLKYALFVSYFPQMIQGPINRFGKLHPQLIAGNTFSADNLKFGIQLMMWGVFKKAFIADPLSHAVSEVYSNFTSYSGAVVFLGVVLYCLQLYCDFSGGTDLVRGASQLFGIEMEENFKRPYFARSVDEFWRRWHISLGDWMKDYLFYPLALSGPLNKFSKRLRKRVKPHLAKVVIPCIATVVVFLAVGIWQGPGLQNIAYGLWNGCLMSLAILCEPWMKKCSGRLGISEEKRWFRIVQVLRTCLLVVIGRYFSRASGLGHALKMLWRTVRYFGWSSLGISTFTCFGLDVLDWVQVLLALGVLLFVSVLQEKGGSVRKMLEKKHWSIQCAVLFAAILLLLSFVYLNTDYTAIMYVYENV